MKIIIKKTYSKIAVCCALSFMLWACGGSDTAPVSPPVVTTPLPPVTPPPPPPEPKVVVGYGDGFTEISSSGINYKQGYLFPKSVAEGNSSQQHPEDFAGGAAAGDYDNDGDIDVFIVRGDIGPNLLYQNDGTGHFVDVALQAGLAYTKSASQNYRHSGPTFADMDGDGDLDLFIGGIEFDPAFIYSNNGDGTFTNVTSGSGIDLLSTQFTLSSAFGDYDGDGDLDMFLTHWGNPVDIEAPGDTGHLWRNDSVDGNIKFTDVSKITGVTAALLIQPKAGSALGDNHDYSFTPNFADINNDGWLDLLVTGDFSTSRVLTNNRNGSFSNATDEKVIIDDSGMGAAVADFDNDGDLDWFVSAITGPLWPIGNRFYLNTDGQFSNGSVLAAININTGTSQQKSSWGWGSCAADFDSDGNLDIYMTNGFPYSFSDNNISFDFNLDTTRVFMGLGDATFEEKSADLGLNDTHSSRTVVCADFDNDGDIDVLQLHRDEINAASLFRNDIQQNNALSIKITMPGHKNRFAIGARIYLKAGGITQMREITLGSNFTAQNPSTQFFGLGTVDIVDSIRVVWPDGTETLRTNVSSGQSLTISKP